MSVKNTLLIIGATLFYTGISNAGCLEPQKNMGMGDFVVESCSFHITTKLRYEDPRLSKQKIENPADILTIEKKKGPGKILPLQKGNFGVLVSGKFNKENVTAFIKTDNSKYCDRFAKNKVVNATMIENCCDCMHACEEAPCALETKNELLVK